MNNGEEYPDLPQVKLVPPKERWAIAQSVFEIFKWLIGGLFAGGFLTVAISMLATKGNADLTVKLLKEAILPFIEEVAKFAATVFSPLLAFILGYYFGSGKNHSD
jgi:hypothetical protein